MGSSAAATFDYGRQCLERRPVGQLHQAHARTQKEIKIVKVWIAAPAPVRPNAHQQQRPGPLTCLRRRRFPIHPTPPPSNIQNNLSSLPSLRPPPHCKTRKIKYTQPGPGITRTFSSRRGRARRRRGQECRAKLENPPDFPPPLPSALAQTHARTHTPPPTHSLPRSLCLSVSLSLGLTES